MTRPGPDSSRHDRAYPLKIEAPTYPELTGDQMDASPSPARRRYAEQFPKHAVLVVVHVNSADQALRSATTARATSGPGTGHAADLAKIATMLEAIGDHPLAVASGTRAENVGQFMPYVDAFLVATGVSRSFEELDAVKVTALVDRAAGAPEVGSRLGRRPPAGCGLDAYEDRPMLAEAGSGR